MLRGSLIFSLLAIVLKIEPSSWPFLSLSELASSLYGEDSGFLFAVTSSASALLRLQTPD